MDEVKLFLAYKEVRGENDDDAKAKCLRKTLLGFGLVVIDHANFCHTRHVFLNIKDLDTCTTPISECVMTAEWKSRQCQCSVEIFKDNI